MMRVPLLGLPQFAFKALGCLVVHVGSLLAHQCDAYVHKMEPTYTPGKLHKIITESKCCKARLLHYFAMERSAGDIAIPHPPLDQVACTGERVATSDHVHVCPRVVGLDGAEAKESAEDQDSLFSDWCGWHNDHGSLTGLVPAMYIDANGQEIDCPDPNAGLYIRNRT